MRVLLTSFGSYGDLNPYLGLGLALKSKGHQPVLAGLPPTSATSRMPASPSTRRDPTATHRIEI